MAIDLRKNKDSLTKAYEKVVNDKDDTDWALFGYEGQTPVLKAVETGDGGIEEMADELSSGKMLYAYCRVKDPNTGLFKFVLIHWSGESVPENLKLKYTTHIRDVQTFLRGAHLTIPARSEEDIDAEDIIKKVAMASGANYSFHKEKAQKEVSPTPVGTDYQRVRPDKEINLTDRDKFWSQTEKEETVRQKQDFARTQEERNRFDKERKERELKETKEREKRISEHMKDVQHQKVVEKKANEVNQDKEKKKWERIQKESSIDEEERGHRSDQMRKERTAEATKLTSSVTSNARDFFKQKSVERPDAGSNRAPPPPRKICHAFEQKQKPQEVSPARKQPLKLPKSEEMEPVAPSKPERQPEPEPEPQTAYVPEPESEPVPEPARQPEPVPEPPKQTEPVSPTPATPTELQTQDLLHQGLPPRQDSDEEDQDWNETPAEDFTFRENRVPSFHEDYSEQQHADTESKRISSAQSYPQDEEQQEEAPLAADNENHGLCAKALYDYQAADETEITFDPDDIITNIEQIDEGWWQGFSPDGSYGMFPSNYVELI